MFVAQVVDDAYILAYAEKLRSNGVPVEFHVFKGAIHAFFGFASKFPSLNNRLSIIVVGKLHV